MALTPTINANKATTLTVARANTPSLRANKATALAVVNRPSDEVQANQAAVMVPVRASHEMHVNSATVLVVAKGRIAHPNMLIWTAALDDHEFLFIQLQTETLVYDFLAKQWSTWGAGENNKMAVQVGQNWNADIGSIMAGLGGATMSNIVCGDDTTGALYFMNPLGADDDDALGSRKLPFRRAITGQLLTRDRGKTRLNRVEVMSSSGFPVSGENLTVTLEYSDDKGVSYRSAGGKTIAEGNYSAAFEWRSLGSYGTPGRLVRLVDYGGLTRVDDWTSE